MTPFHPPAHPMIIHTPPEASNLPIIGMLLIICAHMCINNYVHYMCVSQSMCECMLVGGYYYFIV